MKTPRSLLFCLFVLIPYTIIAQYFTPNSIDSLGRKQGFWIEYKIPFELATGEVLIKFPETKREYYSLQKGKDRKYFPIIECIGNYEAGNKSGEWIEYYWNDAIYSRINYEKGVPFGRGEHYWINGVKKMDFEIGVSDSVSVSTYNDQGELMRKRLVSKLELIQLIHKGF